MSEQKRALSLFIQSARFRWYEVEQLVAVLRIRGGMIYEIAYLPMGKRGV